MTGAFDRWLYFVEPGQRLPWVGLGFLAVLVTGLEVAAALLIFLVLRMVADPAAPLTVPLLGDLRQRITGDDVLVVALLAIGGFFLLRAVAALAQSYAQGRVAQGAGVRLSSRLFRGYLRMPYPLHLRRNSAELIRNVNEAVTDVVSYALVPALRLASEALVVVGLSVALVLTAPGAALLALALFAPLVVVLLRLVQPRIAALGRVSHELGKTTLQALQHSLHGFRDIVVLGRRDHFHRRYVETREGIARTRYIRQVLGDMPRVALETGLVLFVVALILVTIRGGGSPQESLAVLGMFGYAALRILPSVNRVILQINDLKFGAAAAEAVYDDLVAMSAHESAAAEEDADTAGQLPLRREIRLEQASYAYPETPEHALSDVDLTIRRGESIGVVGPTGGGKSTLVDVILGLLPPSRGRVLVDGVNIGTNLPAWRRNLGVVPQTVYLLDDTLRSNIALGSDDHEIDEGRVREAVRLAQLEGFVAALPEGLDTVVGERGVRVSGGERQRVAIARALYRRPAVLVFDEGTSALDNLTEAELIAALESLRGTHTMITVAHRLTTVRRCDRVVLIDGGRVVDVGPYDDLLQRNATFRQMAS